MVKVRCIRCTGEAEGKTAAEAADRVDHAIGRSKGRACAGGDNAPYTIIGAAPEAVSKPKVEAVIKTSKPKKKSK